jgi:hypothetical protein
VVFAVCAVCTMLPQRIGYPRQASREGKRSRDHLVRHAGADVRRPRLLSRTLPSPEPPADHEVPAPDPPSLLNSPSRVMCRLLHGQFLNRSPHTTRPASLQMASGTAADRCDLGPRERRTSRSGNYGRRVSTTNP